MSSRDVAKLLGVTLTTIREWERSHLLRPSRVEPSVHGPKGTMKKIYARRDVLRIAHGRTRDGAPRGATTAHVFSLIREGRASGVKEKDLFRDIVIQTGQEAPFIRALFREYDTPPDGSPEENDANEAKEEAAHDARVREDDAIAAARRAALDAAPPPFKLEDDAAENGEIRTGFRRSPRMSRANR